MSSKIRKYKKKRKKQKEVKNIKKSLHINVRALHSHTMNKATYSNPDGQQVKKTESLL